MDLLVLGATAYRCRTRIARRFWPEGRFAPRRIMRNRLASLSATLAIWLRRRSRILGQRPRAAGRARASCETGSNVRGVGGRSPLVGRAAELAHLESCLLSARRGE